MYMSNRFGFENWIYVKYYPLYWLIDCGKTSMEKLVKIVFCAILSGQI